MPPSYLGESVPVPGRTWTASRPSCRWLRLVRRRPVWKAAGLLLMVALLAACEESATFTPVARTASTPSAPPTETRLSPTVTPAQPVRVISPGDSGESMGEAALGGTSQTFLLSQQIIGELPEGDLVWAAHEVDLTPGQGVEHSHEFAFIYALTDSHLLSSASESWQLLPGAGVAVDSDITHRHGAQENESTYLEIRLAAAGGDPPELPPENRLVFESGPLRGAPSSPLAAFALSRMPPGSRTSIHAHPGPEFIYQLTGEIEYENPIVGVRRMGPGDVAGAPSETAVQKRNPFREDAVFLSWFLLDPALPFASRARFEPGGAEK